MTTESSKKGKKQEKKAQDPLGHLKKLGEHTESLSCKLTEAEKLERGHRLAQLHEELATERANADMVKKELKAREARLEEEANRLAAIVRAGSEPRPVRITQWADYERGVYEEVREDTQQVIPASTRPLRADERQERLPMGGEKNELFVDEADER